MWVLKRETRERFRVVVVLSGGRVCREGFSIKRWWRPAALALGSQSKFRSELEPSRPGEFHPEPLTEPDLNLSAYPARATPEKAAALRQDSEFLRLPVDSISPGVTCPISASMRRS
jgi:hypothetical protein